MNEVHKTIIIAIIQTANTYANYLALYKYRYQGIDQNVNFVLPEDVINKIRTIYQGKHQELIDESDALRVALYEVNDIYAIDTPNTYAVFSEHELFDKDLADFVENITTCEQDSLTSLEVFDELLTALKDCLSKCNAQSSSSVVEYQSGGFLQLESTKRIVNMSEACYNYNTENGDMIEAVWENHEQIREAQAEARTVNGVVQVITGVIVVVVGAVCIVVTAGAATPIVVAGGIAGGGTVLFGVADITTGGQDIYHGANGDISTQSVNFVRDTVFNGNQEVYNTTKNVFLFSASACIPIAGTAKLAQLTIRSGTVIVGKEVAGEVAGFGADHLGEQIGMSPIERVLFGVGTSMLTAKSLDSFDKALHISGVNVPTPKIHADDIEHGVAYDVDSVDFTPDASAEKLSELGHYDAEAKAAASSVEDILVNPKSVGGAVEDGVRIPNYQKLGEELGIKITNEGYKIIDIEDAAKANASWADMGYNLPPVAKNTKAYNVEAGNFEYARVFKNGVNNPKSPFILRSDDIKGLSAAEIAEKYALPQVPDSIVYPHIPTDTPLEVSIVGPQKSWGTIGGDAQYAIKDVLLDDDWFTDIHPLD